MNEMVNQFSNGTGWSETGIVLFAIAVALWLIINVITEEE